MGRVGIGEEGRGSSQGRVPRCSTEVVIGDSSMAYVRTAATRREGRGLSCWAAVAASTREAAVW